MANSYKQVRVEPRENMAWLTKTAEALVQFDNLQRLGSSLRSAADVVNDNSNCERIFNGSRPLAQKFNL